MDAANITGIDQRNPLHVLKKMFACEPQERVMHGYDILAVF